ncbi:MAG TPA: hypothetical protein VII98_04775 [Solirubrobacteraceae bacterium]
MIQRAAAVALLLLAWAAPAHAAGPPIMPLDQVRAGIDCTAASVVRGTDISTFAAHVDDVLGSSDIRQARILVTVSGAAIDATGVGPGFSGSPVSCPGPDGAPLIVGAISETIGAYGGKTVLVTPIQAILGESVDPPQAATHAPRRTRALLRAARPIAEPLSISGLSPAVGAGVVRAARLAGRAVISAPARPRQAAGAPAPLQPGSAMAVGLSSGDVQEGAIGTVAYVDGDTVWAFGHPLDGAGRRELFLSDAYVYDVVNNPLGTQDAATYKLASPTTDVGTLRQDGISAVVGRLGALPRRFPATFATRDLDTGRTGALHVQVADERAVGLPTGTSALSTVAPTAVAQAIYNALDGSPVNQTDQLCLRISVRQARRPLAFCNRYAGAGGGADALLGGPLVADVVAATQLIDAYGATNLDITGVNADVRVQRGLQLASLASLRGPVSARRGSDVSVGARLIRPGGATLTRTIRVHVPEGMPTGARDLLLKGTSADQTSGSGSDSSTTIDLSNLFAGSPGEGSDGPTSVRELGLAMSAIHRYDGVTTRFLPPGADPQTELPGGAEGVAQRSRETYRDAQLRIAGSARLRITIRR